METDRVALLAAPPMPDARDERALSIRTVQIFDITGPKAGADDDQYVRFGVHNPSEVAMACYGPFDDIVSRVGP